MNNGKLFRTLLVLLSLCISPVAIADVYVLAGGGITTHEYSNVSGSSSFKAGVGFISGRGGLGIEANYYNFGDASIASPTGTLSMNGTSIYGVYEIPLNNFGMVIKAGIYNIDATAVTTGTASASTTGFAWGFTFNYEIDEAMYLFMDTEGFGLVDTTATLPETPTLITFGIRYNI